MKLKLKVGLVGCGQIVQAVHLRVLKQSPQIELVALAEADPERLEEVQRLMPSATIFSDYRELMQIPDLEAVIICLPNVLHAEAATAALKHGKHVYLEKPLAIDLDEAQNLIASWRDTNLVDMIGFNYRFDPLYVRLREKIQDNVLGEPIAVRTVFSTAAKTLPLWKQKRRSGGGVLLDLASHHIDLVRLIFGQEISEVSAEMRSERSEDDNAVLQIRMENDLLIQSFFSLNSVEEDKIEVYGQSGKLLADRYVFTDIKIDGPYLDLVRVKQLRHAFGSLVASLNPLKRLRGPHYLQSYRSAFEHFAACVRTGQPATPNFKDGYQSLLVIDAAEQSARTGSPVSLEERISEDIAY